MKMNETELKSLSHENHFGNTIRHTKKRFILRYLSPCTTLYRRYYIIMYALRISRVFLRTCEFFFVIP